jgi:hypothetical protein
MNPLFVAAAAVQDLCRERGWGFCFIGGSLYFAGGSRDSPAISISPSSLGSELRKGSSMGC